MIIFLSLLFNVYALTFEVANPCNPDEVILDYQAQTKGLSVGEVTFLALKKANAAFIGNENAINSIFNTPTGLEAMEVISDSEMKVYGWCYQVDGVLPELLIGDYILNGSETHLKWIYGHAHYIAGEWESYCSDPIVQPTFICKKE